jgi:hypothetical protein
MLRLGEAREAIEQRRTQLMKARVCELHLRFDAGRADDAELRCGADEILEQRCLSNAGFAADHERASFAGADIGKDFVQRAALIAPPA